MNAADQLPVPAAWAHQLPEITYVPVATVKLLLTVPVNEPPAVTVSN